MLKNQRRYFFWEIDLHSLDPNKLVTFPSSAINAVRQILQRNNPQRTGGLRDFEFREGEKATGYVLLVSGPGKFLNMASGLNASASNVGVLECSVHGHQPKPR